MGIKGKEKKRNVIATRRAKRAKKIAARSANPAWKETVKKPKATESSNAPGTVDGSIPISTTKSVTNNLQHGKWPSMFRKHIGLIEAHIETLERLMQSIKSQMALMEEKERIEWEIGERGNWRLLCDMMDRAKEVLTNARASARDILPTHTFRDKAGIGFIGETSKPLGPKLAERADELKTKREAGTTLAADKDTKIDGDGDTEMSDGSESPDSSNSASMSNSDVYEVSEQSFVPLSVNSKQKKALDSGAGLETKENLVKPNPYFVVDTNPTSVTVISSGSEKKKNKSKSKDNSKKSKTVVVEPLVVEQPISNAGQTEVDFTAIQAQLAAEVEAGLKAQQEAELEEASSKSDFKKDKKKRKRHSEGLSAEGLVVEKKARKESSEKKEKEDKKRVSEFTGEETHVKEAGKNKKHKSAG